jgi:DNA-binding transcriptional LysR family regulator
MDKLAAIETFHSIARNGSLTAASLRLGKSVPTVVRTLAQLEESLGVRLFNRTTRRIDLTEEGAVYLAETQRLLAELGAAEARITGTEMRLTGRIVVGAPIFFGERFVAPALASFALEHPELTVRLRLADGIEDLLDRHIDVAVRIGHLPSSELVRLKVGEVRAVICASPDFLARAGAPRRPADLLGQPCIIIDNNTAGRIWSFICPDGTTEKIELEGAFTANTMRATRAACLAGVGFGWFLSYQVAADIGNGTLAKYEQGPIPVQLVHAAGRMPARRIQSVCEALRQELGDRLAAIALPDPPDPSRRSFPGG